MFYGKRAFALPSVYWRYVLTLPIEVTMWLYISFSCCQLLWGGILSDLVDSQGPIALRAFVPKRAGQTPKS